MPRTVWEVQECKAVIDKKYRPSMGSDGSAEDAGIPPWPSLAPLQQRL
jgi:hypothetical protein